MNKMYHSSYESIHGFSVNVAFTSKDEASEFARRTQIGYTEVEVLDALPEKFMFCVIFDCNTVEVKVMDVKDTGRSEVGIWSPTSCTVYIAAPSADEAEGEARKAVISFIESNPKDLRTNVQYSMTDGSVVKQYSYPDPLFGPLKEAFLSYMKKDGPARFSILFKFALERMLKINDSIGVDVIINKLEDKVYIEEHTDMFCPAEDSIYEAPCSNTIRVYDVHREDVENILSKMNVEIKRNPYGGTINVKRKKNSVSNK